MYRTLLFILVIIAIGLISCESDEPQCYEPTNVTAHLNFVYMVDSTDTVTNPNPNQPPIPKDTVYIFDTALNYPIATSLVEGSSNYSVQATQSYKQSNFYLFLNPDTNYISYKIQTDSSFTDSLLDTLTLYYRPSLHFISNACGYTYYYTIDSVRATRHVFDTVYVPDPSITVEASKVNVRLGFIRQ